MFHRGTPRTTVYIEVVCMISMNEKDLRLLLIRYDELYRQTSTPLWRESRQRDDKKEDFEFFEKTYNIFTKEREISLAEDGLEYFENRLKELKGERRTH